MTKKYFLYIFVLFLAFGYGFSVGFFKIFPFDQALSIKHYIEHKAGQFESQPVTKNKSVEIYNSFLSRLLLKRIQIPEYTGGGGGITNIENTLYIVSNKGSVLAYSLSEFSKFKTNIEEVPMNFGDLIQSGHPYDNDFRINWFRVNGVYAEKQDSLTHIMYVSHNAYDKDTDCITHNISRLKLKRRSENIIQEEEWHTILTASPCIEPVPEKWLAATPYSGHISGGKIVNYDKNRLLVSIGDYNRHGINGVDEYAMDPTKPYGKFLLVNKQTGTWSVFAMGTRNPSGLFIDNDGTIWSSENGPEGGDELNIIKESENYGWPKESFGLWYDHDFNLPGNSKRGRHNNYTKPIYSWVPSIAPSNLIKIEGSKFDTWKGDLLMGSMRDQSLHRLRLDKENEVVYDEKIDIGHRIRDLTILPDDKIALITDDGLLIIIDDGGPIFKEMTPEEINRMSVLNNFDRFNSGKDDSVRNFNISSARQIYQKHCASCHNLDPSNQIGPHLNNLYGREIGSLNDFNYSRTLKMNKKKWTPSLLKSYLENPVNEFSGTNMPNINISSSEVDSLVKFLRSKSLSN